jgi:hypothetical protein
MHTNPAAMVILLFLHGRFGAGFGNSGLGFNGIMWHSLSQVNNLD